VVIKARAFSEEDKQARRARLLSEARLLLDEKPFGAVKVSEVAARAGLAKGTVFLYFPTKEALFLDLLEELLDGWFGDLDGALARAPAGVGAEQTAAVLVESLSTRATLTRLLTLLSTVLEHNVDLERVVRFKTFLARRLAKTGSLLERALPGLGEGEGARLGLQIYAVVIGLRQAADTPPVVAEALSLPALAGLAIDFERELAIVLRALLRGLSRP
jgi:AcrR family transcriptional regulator